MPKIKGIGRASLKKPSQQVENLVIKQTKLVRKPGKLGVEIDEIFAGRKKKKPEPEIKESKEEIAKRERKRKRKEREGVNKNPTAQPRKRIEDNSQNRPRKKTEDGLPVFTEDELGINKANAGDTPLCPFDCNCCF